MILSTWNVRGLNHPSTIGEVKKYLRNNKISFIGILETKFKTGNKDKIRKKFIDGWNRDDNYEKSQISRRIWLA